MSAASAVMNVSPAHRLKLGIAANFCFAECETRISELDALVEDDSPAVESTDIDAVVEKAVDEDVKAEDEVKPEVR